MVDSKTIFHQLNHWRKLGFQFIQKMIDHADFKHPLLLALPFFVASILTGFVAFLYANLFEWAEQITQGLIHQHRWIIFVLSPLGFLVSWFLVNRFDPYASGSGIPQVMAAIELSNPKQRHWVRKFLNLRIVWVKILASVAKVLGGGVIGREGPTIQIGAAIFSTIQRILPKDYPKISQKNTLIAGAASGLAAAFNTPLGGIVFAIEELSKQHIKYYKSSLFVAVIIAGFVAQELHGPYLYLGYPILKSGGWVFYFGLLVVPLLCGIFSAYTGKAILFLNLKFGALSIKNRLGVVIGFSLIVATIIFFWGYESAGSGKDLMVRLLYSDHKTVTWYQPILRMIGMSAVIWSWRSRRGICPIIGRWCQRWCCGVGLVRPYWPSSQFIDCYWYGGISYGAYPFAIYHQHYCI